MTNITLRSALARASAQVDRWCDVGRGRLPPFVSTSRKVGVFMRALRTAVAVTGLVFTSVVVGVTSAQANEADCPGSRVCLWDDGNYTGGLKILSGSTTDLVDFHDRMASWKNTYQTQDAKWFYNNNYSGTARCMNSVSKNAYVGYTDNNELDSVAIYYNNTIC